MENKPNCSRQRNEITWPDCLGGRLDWYDATLAKKVAELRCSQPETLVRMYRELADEYGELAVGSHDRAVGGGITVEEVEAWRLTQT